MVYPIYNNFNIDDDYDINIDNKKNDKSIIPLIVTTYIIISIYLAYYYY